MSRNILIVGPSGSGKTTAAEIVSRELGVPMISMDDFRIRRVTLFVDHNGTMVRNFEDPALWQGHAIACKLRAMIRLFTGFVCEGNHLLHYPEILELPYTERYYIDVPFSVSLERRKCRHRFLPADESFALIGARETARWIEPQKLLPGVRVIDGTAPADVIANSILGHQHA